jgi:hypothetical protein
MDYPSRTLLILAIQILLSTSVIAFSGRDTLQVEEFYPESRYSVQSNKTKFSIDPQHHVLYIGQENRLSGWDYHRDSLIAVDTFSQSIEDYMMAYDTVGNRLLLWARGIGTLYAWEESTQRLHRLDQSFDHKNQFGHSASIHPVNGQLFAFGGYGLWTSKNYITRYDELAGEWFVVDDQASNKYPKPRMNAYTTWISPNTLIMLGGRVNDSFVPHRTPAQKVTAQTLWMLDIKTGRWSPEAEISLPNTELVSYNRSNFREFTNLYTYSSSLDIWFMLGLENDEGAQELIAVEPRTGRYRVIELPQLDLGRSKIILNMAWDSESQQIILAGVLNTSENQRYPVFLAKVNFENWSNFKTQLQNPSASLSKDTILNYMGISPLGLGWLLLGLFSGGLIVWGTMKWQALNSIFRNPKESTSTTKNSNAPSDEGLYLAYEEGKNIDIYYFGENLKDWLSPLQSQMVVYLYLSALKGNRYRSIDQLEELFWNGQQNRDYIRKLRNKDLNQLIDVAKKVAPAKYHPIINRKKDPQDKRRLVYGLNKKLSVREHLNSTHRLRYWKNIRTNDLAREAFIRALNNTYNVDYLSSFLKPKQ